MQAVVDMKKQKFAIILSVLFFGLSGFAKAGAVAPPGMPSLNQAPSS
jgi:hypothetical protein